MKILFAGDYSNFHATLAAELRRRGHQAVVMSAGSRCMDTERDIDLRRTPGASRSLLLSGKALQAVAHFEGLRRGAAY